MNNIKTIALADIRIDGGTQARTGISEEAVSEYADALTEGASLPAVVVFFDGTTNWLADGFHRFLANSRIGAVTLAADVRAGSLADAQLFAYGANQTHGLRRTNEDKRKAVDGVLALKPDWSDSKISRHVGVSDKTVAARRRSILGISDDAPQTRTVERAGKTYTQDVSGQREAAQQRAGAATGATQQAAPERIEQDPATRGSALPASEPPAIVAQRVPGPVTAVDPEQAADDEFGDADPISMLEDMHKQVEELTALVAAAEADDLKAEAMKWRQMYEQARRSQADAMDNAARSAKELDALRRDMQAIGRAVGEQDLRKVVRATQAFVRQHKVTA